MTLTFGEVAQLDQYLTEEGEKLVSINTRELLRKYGAWYEAARDEGNAVVDAGMFARLCGYVRRSSDGRVKNLAMGALELAFHEAEDAPDRAAFAIKFAMQRVRTLSGDTPLLSAVRLSEREEKDAHALYAAAVGDHSFADEDLIRLAEKFIDEHKGGAYVFGKLATELQLLLNVLRTENAKPERLQTARAALIYFAVVADAIPDDLGLVGLLDDIFIVQKAVRELYPERGALCSFLDEVIQHWPFVRDVMLEAARGKYSLSEFMLVNAALLLDEVSIEERARAIALVVPDPGHLAFIIGFVRALAEINQSMGSGEVPHFDKNERMINRETEAEVVFESYGKLVDGAFQPGPEDGATHFQFRARQKKRAAAEIKWTRETEDLCVFRRSGKQTGRMKAGKPGFDRSNVQMGPLDRLFNSLEPLVIPAERKRVVIVGTLRAMKSIASDMTLFGVPLIDVIPTGQANFRGGSLEEASWTKREVGGRLLLTIVRTTADAAALCEVAHDDVAAVISNVHTGSTDAANLARISATGIPVVAIVEDRDTESHEHLRNKNYRFWNWDNQWFGVLHWPHSVSEGTHPIGDYEIRLRKRSKSKLSVAGIDLPGLSDAYQALSELERISKNGDEETLKVFIGEGFRALLGLSRWIAPVGESHVQTVRSFIDGAQNVIISSAMWWNDESTSVANRTISAFEQSIDAILAENPKFTAIEQWADHHPNGVIVCRRYQKSILEQHLESKKIHLVQGVPVDSMPEAVLFPAWEGKDKMERYLHPPCGERTTLLLYPPECEWYERSEMSRRRSARLLRSLAVDRKAFATFMPKDVQTSDVEKSFVPTGSEPDELVARSRRIHAERALSAIEGEAVRARLVHFAGGHWAAFTPKHRVHTITHLLEGSDRDEEDSEIQETLSSDLQIGDLVLLLRGTNRDALREAVDQVAPTGIRTTAGEWRRALIKYVERGHSVASLTEELARLGCRRARSTVERWIEDDSIIGPLHGESDIEAIVAVTGDDQLTVNAASCNEAIAQLRSLHQKMARQLARKVLERTREWLEAGAAPDELVEVEDQLVLVTVDAIDPELIDAPRGAVDRLREDKWQG